MHSFAKKILCFQSRPLSDLKSKNLLLTVNVDGHPQELISEM